MKKSMSALALLSFSLVLWFTHTHMGSSRASDGPFFSPPLAGGETGPLSLSPQSPALPVVNLRAASGSTIPSRTQNGETRNGIASQAMDLPHLVLSRNGALTGPEERTLIVELSNITVPPAGVTVTIDVETQHGDPDAGGGTANRITVWHESRPITNTRGITETGITTVFVHQFARTTQSGDGETVTPTDYLRYHVQVWDTLSPSANPRFSSSQDYALLMEGQWITPLPEVRETSPGAAPDELIVYACDMFPFRKEKRDPSSWLPREGVPGYIQVELIPALVEAFRLQSDEWGFPWDAAWTSFRSGEDTERLSVALVKGGTWFHGNAPSNGHSAVSLRVDGDGYISAYDTLTDALVSVFHHELFHNLQKNIQQMNGAVSATDAEEDISTLVFEGTAVLAASAGRLAIEFEESPGVRHYMDNANRFLGGPGHSGELNRSYANMSPYHTAIYWRFLYEQCRGTTNGRQDTAAGMDPIRQVLTELFSGDVVEHNTSTTLAENLAETLDRALASSSCPFQTHRQSLVAFAAAINGLRLDGGRCTAPGSPAGCGFFDPHVLYHDPPVDTVTYSGAELVYQDGIKSSFGMDFVDVILDPAVDGTALTVEFFGDPDAEAQFDVQLLFLVDDGAGSRPRRAAITVASLEAMPGPAGTEHLLAAIPVVDTHAYNRLALIITRLDGGEASDPTGAYTITLRPGAGG